MISGSYGQAIHRTHPTNTKIPRTLDVIYLKALDMVLGEFEVMDILTEKIMTLRKVIPIPITLKRY